MKTPEQMDRWNKTGAAVLSFMVLIIMLLVATSCSTLDPAARYAKETKEYSFEHRKSANRAFSLSNAKENLKEAKGKNRKEGKKARDQAKIDAIVQKTQDLKSN